MLKWKIDVLKALKAKGYNQQYILSNKIIGSSTLTNLRCGNTNLSLATLDTLCHLLECQPADLLEYINDVE